MTLSIEPLLVFAKEHRVNQTTVFCGQRGRAESVCHELGHWAALGWAPLAPMRLSGVRLSSNISHALGKMHSTDGEWQEALAWAVEWHLCRIFDVRLKWPTLVRYAQDQIGSHGRELVLLAMEDTATIDGDVYRAVTWVFDTYREWQAEALR